jgi:hypothetical protein
MSSEEGEQFEQRVHGFARGAASTRLLRMDPVHTPQHGDLSQVQMCMWSLLMEQKGMSKTGRTWMDMHGMGASDASYRKFKDQAFADSIQQLKYKTYF